MAHKEQIIIENKKENEVMSVGLDTVNNVESLVKKLAKSEKLKIFATYSQEQVDKIFLAASLAANKQRVPLAIMAQKELVWELLKIRL